MCDGNKHEFWVTPESSKHLTSKQVILHPGEEMHEHTTGPGREEVIVCLFGQITVFAGDVMSELSFGNTAFIPENTLHRVVNEGDEDAAYMYVVSKKKVCNRAILPEDAHWMADYVERTDLTELAYQLHHTRKAAAQLKSSMRAINAISGDPTLVERAAKQDAEWLLGKKL